MDSRAARRQARLAKIAKGARGVRTPSRPAKQYSTTPAASRPRGLRDSNAVATPAPVRNVETDGSIRTTDKENKVTSSTSSSSSTTLRPNRLSVNLTTTTAATPAPVKIPESFAPACPAPAPAPAPAHKVDVPKASSPAEPIVFGDMLSDLLSPEPPAEEAAAPQVKAALDVAPRAPSPAESIGFGDLLSELLSPEPDEEVVSAPAPAPASAALSVPAHGCVSAVAAHTAVTVAVEDGEQTAECAPAATCTASTAISAAPPCGSSHLSAPSKPPRRKSQLAGIEIGTNAEAPATLAAATTTTTTTTTTAAAAASAAALSTKGSAFATSNPFIAQAGAKNPKEKDEAGGGAAATPTLEDDLPTTPARAAAAAVQWEQAPQLTTPVVMRRAAKTPGREYWIRTPSRSIPEQIELQKTMVAKTNEMLQLIGPTAPLSVVKEARKSRIVEGFRMETLTSAKSRKPQWALNTESGSPNASMAVAVTTASTATATATATSSASTSAVATTASAASSSSSSSSSSSVTTTTTTTSCSSSASSKATQGKVASKRNITISGISVPLTGDALTWSDEERKDCDFFVMINVGTQVACTDIVSLQDVTATTLDFFDPHCDSKFIFENLGHDFEMDVQLYASKAAEVTKKRKGKKIGKKIAHSANKGATKAYKQMKKLGKRGSRMLDGFGSHGHTNNYTEINSKPGHSSSKHSNRKSSTINDEIVAAENVPQFEKIATATINLHQLFDGCHTLSEISSPSFPVRNQLILNASVAQPETHPHCEGSLTKFDAGSRQWSRHWAVLHRDALQFYNSRRQARSGATPISTIMLGVNATFTNKLARASCARKNSFGFISGEDAEGMQHEHRFVCDSKEQRSDWMISLNEAVSEFTTWPGSTVVEW